MSSDPTHTEAGLAGIDFPVVLFDGTCGFCNGSVRWVVERDHLGRLHFAPQTSEMGAFLLAEQGLEEVAAQSLILVEEGRAYTRSTAALRIAGFLQFPWSWLRVLLWVPRVIRDGVYDLVARNRYRLAGQQETCLRPDPAWAGRFHH